MPPRALFGRRWSLQVGSIDLTDLDLAFHVERTIHRSPNTAAIKVWNLSEETRATLEAHAHPRRLRPGESEDVGGIVRLGASLGQPNDDPPLIFRGDLRVCWTVWESNVDAVTNLTARDGGRAYSEATIARSYRAGTPIVNAVRDAIGAMDIGAGNLSEFETALVLRTGSDQFADGYVAHGPAHAVLNDLVRAAGLRWSVQSGALQLQRVGEALQTRAVVLSAASGMLDVPTWDERGNRTQGRRGTLTVKALIRPGLEPGRRVIVESSAAEGEYEIRKAIWDGNTRTNDWHITLECRPPRPRTNLATSIA